MKWYNDLSSEYPTKEIIREIRRKREEEEIEKQERLKQLEKQRKYAKFVKEMHWPKVSKVKQQEMKSLKSSLDFHRPLNRSANSQIIKNRVSTNRSDSRVKKKYDHQSNKNDFSSMENTKNRINATSHNLLKIPKRKWKENNMIPKPQPRKEGKVVDYLLQRRLRRDKYDNSLDNRNSQYRNPYLDLRNLVTDRSASRSTKNFSSLEHYGLNDNNKTIDASLNDKHDRIHRLDQIRQATKQIEDTVNRKEQLMKYQGASINENVGVNDMLIHAIEAKLKILEDL